MSTHIDTLVDKHLNEGIREWAQEHTMDLLSFGVCASLAAVWDYVLFVKDTPLDPKTSKDLVEVTVSVMTIVWLPSVISLTIDTYHFIKDIIKRFWDFVSGAGKKKKQEEAELKAIIDKVKSKLGPLKDKWISVPRSERKPIDDVLNGIEKALIQSDKAELHKLFKKAEDVLRKSAQ